ncbi:MAG: helix-turn-helix domain-containing protein [Bacteroides sp.]|nr:helix-turn-helix domain-containing protein [Bacteroides sp.]MCM1413437.1 helix-turn-helix domain-containing protein [Bacteroides sp.]MCM1471352.1 helix-turn-helix domain-containing protein [Bacteroides sp.]
MDIVSRLKTFISYLGIPVTQFADNCNIPRPTLSQLLNGRNKKVSDELIGKIHEAFPDLSVLWLMFGEGDMLHDKNISISEAKQGSIFDMGAADEPENENNTPSIDFNNGYSEIESNNFSADLMTNVGSMPVTQNRQKHISDKEESDKEASRSTITFSPNETKKIVNIIIYYNDNSFESFVPKQ